MSDPLSAIKYLYSEFMDKREQQITQIMFFSQGCQVTGASSDGGANLTLILTHPTRGEMSFTISDGDNGKFEISTKPV